MGDSLAQTPITDATCGLPAMPLARAAPGIAIRPFAHACGSPPTREVCGGLDGALRGVLARSAETIAAASCYTLARVYGDPPALRASVEGGRGPPTNDGRMRP